MKRYRRKFPWGHISYLAGGEGDPTLILIHGAGNEAAVWEKVFPQLTRVCQVIALDLPGHGNSAYKSCPTIEDYSSVLLEFAGSLEIEDPVLAGHSMGGAISIKTAPLLRNLRGLVLIGTGALLRVNPKLIDALENDFPKAASTMTRWSFLKGTSPEILSAGEDMLYRAGQAVLLQDMKACDSYSGEDELSKIEAPTLVVCGREDVMTPLSLSEQLRDGIKGAHLSIIENCGHMVQVEKGEELGRIMAEFISSLRR